MRTENDTWDINTSVGATALFVAASRALEAQKPDPLAVDPFAEVFCRAAGGQWADLVNGTAGEHQLTTQFGHHFVDYQGARTRYFDAYFTGAAEAGVRQIVLVAAGLDSRAYRLAWPGGTTVFELDQPRVLEFKREVLAAHGDRPRAERREIPVDLRDDWQSALTASGFDPTRPSAWIAEGLLLYLPAAAQGQLFAGIDALAAAGSRVALEEAVPMPDEVIEAKRAEERASGDTDAFFNLIYNEQHAPAGDWFAARGWAAETTPLTEYLQVVGRPVPGADSEAGLMFATMRLVSAVKR
jgi:methyltransferase (TIGR00027 family)